MIEVQGPDGSVAEFPDNTPPAAIKAAMAKRFGGPSAKPPAMVAAAKGVGMGLADMADLVTSPIRYGYSALLDAAGLPQYAQQQREGLAGAIDRAVPVPRNQSAVQDVFRGMGGAAGGVGAGRALLTLARPGSVAAGAGEALAAHPRLQAVGGAAGSAASSIAAGAGAPALVQLGAGLLAGGLAPAAIDGAMTGTARAVAPLLPGYTREQAARTLQENVSGNVDDVVRRIGQATAAAGLKGVSPTTGEVARDYGLAGLQRSLQSNNAAGGALSQRMASNARGRLRAADKAMGPGDVTRLPAAADATARANMQIAGAARNAVGPLEPADVTGLAARDALTEAARGAKARASRLYDIPGGEELVQVGAVEPDLPMPGPSGMDVPGFRASMEAGLNTPIPAFRASEKGPFALIRSRYVADKSRPGAQRLEGGVPPDSPLGQELIAAGFSPRELPGVFNRNGTMRQGDQLLEALQQNGYMPRNPDGSPATLDGNDAITMLIDDIRGAGRTGYGARPVAEQDIAAKLAHDDALATRNSYEKAFQDAGFDPAKMGPEDWDAFYRQTHGMPPATASQADMEWLGQQADRAQGASVLSPFQASLVDLQRQFFPAGLPAKNNVTALVRQLTNADMMQTREVERVIRDLRAQAGMLRQSDGTSAALAKAAANAAEGFLSSQAGPARMDAMARARAGWRDYASTFKENEPGRVLATNQFGTPNMDAGRVPGALVPVGRTGATAAARLQKALGPDRAESIAETELRRALEAAGDDAGRVVRVADNYADTLRAYPALAERVKAAKESAALAEAFKQSPLAKVGAAGDVPAAVGQLMTVQDGGRGLRQLIGQVRGNNEAMAGLRRAMADHLERVSETRAGVDANGGAMVNNNGLRNGVDAILNRTAMTNLLSREQRSVLLEVRRQAKGAQFAATANRTPGSDTVRNADVWGRMIAKVVADGVGGAGVGKLKTALEFAIAVAGRADAVRELTVQAMLDPKLAAELLKAPTPDRVKALGQRMGAYSLGAARISGYSAERM